MTSWWKKLREANEPDADLPMLTRRDADHLRSSIVEALRPHGALVRFDGENAIITHAQRGIMHIELGGLMREVAGSEHPKAAQIAARTAVEAIFAERSVGEMSTAELYRSLRIRVEPGQYSDRRKDTTAALFNFTADTCATLVLDTETAVKSVSLEQLLAVDSLEILERVARTNLTRELEATSVGVARHTGNPTHAGSYLWSVESESPYTSSAALVLEDLLPVWVSEVDMSEGIIFAMPTKHALLLRPITHGSDLVEGLGAIAAVAHELAERTDGAVSSLIHTYHLGSVDTVSSWDEQTRQLTITPTPHLLNRIQS